MRWEVLAIGLGGKDRDPSFGGLLGSQGGKEAFGAPSIGPQA